LKIDNPFPFYHALWMIVPKGFRFLRFIRDIERISVSPLGRKHCEALRPSKDPAVIQARLAEVLELKEI